VWPCPGNYGRRLGRRLALGHNFDVRLLRGELAQAITDQRLPVDNCELNWHRNLPKGILPPML
jgi:hypothetical protein